MWNINLRSKRQDFDTYFCHIHAILTPMIMTYTYIIQKLTKHVHSQFTQNCVKQLYQPHIPAWHSRGCDTVEISVNTIAWVANTYWELATNKSNFENIMSDTVASIVFADCLAPLRTRTYAGTVMNKPSVTEITLMWMTQNLANEKSTMVPVMACQWAVKQQTITWANVDPELCRHILLSPHAFSMVESRELKIYWKIKILNLPTKFWTVIILNLPLLKIIIVCKLSPHLHNLCIWLNFQLVI